MGSKPSAGRARRSLGGRVATLALLILATWLAGCLTVDGTLRENGTGTLTLSYQAPPGATEASLRELLKAPGITITSLTLREDRQMSATLEVDDPAAISKTALFRNVTVTRTDKDGDQVFVIKVVNQPRTLRNKALPGPKIGITLPGTIVEANEQGVVDGTHVRWSFTAADWLARATWELTARYTPAKAGGAPGGGAPGAEKGTPAPPAAANPAK
jgi:hypothetical protein